MLSTGKILWKMKSWSLDFKIKSNLIFHYTRCITPKRATSLRGSSSRHYAQETQLLSKKCRSSGESLAPLRSIWPTQDLNLRPLASERNALTIEQLVGFIFYKILSVLNIMMTVDSLFLLKTALLSTFLRLKPLSSKPLARRLPVKEKIVH